MFDNEHKIYNNLKVNSISGLIIKTNPKSFFKAFDTHSEVAKSLLSKNPQIEEYRFNCYGRREYFNIEVVILQIMVCGDDRVIAEIMLKEDYDECLKKSVQEVKTDEQDS